MAIFPQLKGTSPIRWTNHILPHESELIALAHHEVTTKLIERSYSAPEEEEAIAWDRNGELLFLGDRVAVFGAINQLKRAEGIVKEWNPGVQKVRIRQSNGKIIQRSPDLLEKIPD